MSKILFIHPHREPRAAPSRFSWGALIFPCYWAFSEGLIPVGGRLLAIDLFAAVLGMLGERIGSDGLIVFACLIFFGKNIFIGFFAPSWLKKFLEKQGYRKIS